MYPILLWKNTMLYTISAISLGRYCFYGNVFAIALTLSLTVLMYHSTSLTCSSLAETFRAISISESLSLIESKAPSASMLHTQNPIACYVQTTCVMDIIIIFFVLSRINLAVPKCIFLDVVTINRILFIAIISTVCVSSL